MVLVAGGLRVLLGQGLSKGRDRQYKDTGRRDDDTLYSSAVRKCHEAFFSPNILTRL